MKQPSDKDIDRLTEVAEEILWHLEKGKAPGQIALLLSKKHGTGVNQMWEFVNQLQAMAQRVAHGGVKLQ